MYILILSFLFTLTNAATLHVPNQYRTINEAFEHVSENDTVLVAEGTHYLYSDIHWPAVNNVHLIGAGEVGDVVLNLKYVVLTFHKVLI